MKYKESLIPKTQKDLHDYICNVMLSAPTRRFLDFEDFDGALSTGHCNAWLSFSAGVMKSNVCRGR